jgi:FKBP-type peptidyl-prolyl cis-trans isomerase FkpA
VAFRDDIYAAQTRAEQLDLQNRALEGELRAAYIGRFPRRSIRRSLAVMGVSVLCLVGSGSVAAFLMLRIQPPPAPEYVAPNPPPTPLLPFPEDALAVDDVVVGEGRAAHAGDRVTVHYVGTFPDGEEFDNSRTRGRPFSFVLGKGQVIKGWEQGLEGMRVGGVRKLTIGSSLAYGERGQPPRIPASATLVFGVDLLAVE